jgi:hypothetical protein
VAKGGGKLQFGNVRANIINVDDYNKLDARGKDLIEHLAKSNAKFEAANRNTVDGQGSSITFGNVEAQAFGALSDIYYDCDADILGGSVSSTNNIPQGSMSFVFFFFFFFC